MADVSITTNDTFSTHTADTNFTRPTNAGETIVINAGQVNIGSSSQAGPITVNIDQDLVCNRLNSTIRILK
jgi:acyl-CoA hydrolase